jgi:hypothetical protein
MQYCVVPLQISKMTRSRKSKSLGRDGFQRGRNIIGWWATFISRPRAYPGHASWSSSAIPGVVSSCTAGLRAELGSVKPLRVRAPGVQLYYYRVNQRALQVQCPFHLQRAAADGLSTVLLCYFTIDVLTG